SNKWGVVHVPSIALLLLHSTFRLSHERLSAFFAMGRPIWAVFFVHHAMDHSSTSDSRFATAESTAFWAAAALAYLLTSAELFFTGVMVPAPATQPPGQP